MSEVVKPKELDPNDEVSLAIDDIESSLDSIEERNYRLQLNSNLPQEVLSFLRTNENEAKDALEVLRNMRTVFQKICARNRELEEKTKNLTDNEASENVLRAEIEELKKANQKLEEQLKESIPKLALAEMFRA